MSILPNLLQTRDELTSFQQAGGMESVIECLKSKAMEVRLAAASSICLLTENKMTARILYDTG